jgi:hypothetical protein
MYNPYYMSAYLGFPTRWGPIADPMPEPWRFRPNIPPELYGPPELLLQGPVADPGPEFARLLDKTKLAEFKVREFDIMIQALEGRLQTVRALQEALKKEHGIK